MLLKNELQELASKKVEVRVIIVNGFQIVGKILDADESAVIVDVNGSRKVVNLSAVSTVELSKG
ncbi:putative RNA chaperone Hfq [Pseudoflavonifractor capillosus ATCC 29799]|jgi:sRNA-binding regulator protein Hfq|uniref:Putative RNA chaperone Hfq n=1 Tax=Pseudoflavonifractor capillosus ATCC 29799 TaxID=411467 RepID=A6NY23_9FIRM|nr:RNA chaperone Hfq [Pseudoflavonifractor capillosus]EDM99193.1 putative RNA chaperone Hfq [Pseudoflavonifractor capillosus ATCC 29799]